MAQRPTLLDLRSKSSSSNMTSASKPLRSPRLHVAGEIPPELSPLDAFALQSRLLARQLKESDNAGRRMSRLPPLTTESPLVMQGRSDYFRSMSQDGMSEASQSPEPLDRGLGLMPEVEENLQRPMSMHPRMSRIPPTPDDGIPLPPQPMLDQTRGRTLNHIREDSTNFGARREESPTPMESAQLDEPSSSVVPSPRKDTAASLPMPSSSNSLVASPEKMPKKHSFDGPGLAPPRPMFVKRPSASSTMSSPLVPTDEDGVMSSSFHSLPHRKLSSGSAMSIDYAFRQRTVNSERCASITAYSTIELVREDGAGPYEPGETPSPNPSRPSTESSRASEDETRGRPLTSPLHDSARLKTAVSIATSDSASTVKPAKSLHSIAPSAADMTAEEHLAKGIECHENGSVNESTYHLRHAAKQNHPTGMLLYALACRHGWGMRPNQREGVEWLRKASELVSNEIADDEGQVKQGKHVDVLDRKTRKAQFALAVYELGVSHMNGWGIEQDKVLALRCFEIAGSWGDLDALAEAGYCYAQGGAESKGMSMVGNSWIHKSKYNDDSKELKKVRSKSRTRNIFGIKTGGS
ncbi:Mitosis inhibitor nif1 like protein [Verticillium longisporum]|uniref:Mitosis inhibitor nif1 like protein n=1 Tax=Verticillium longisporum TaxID=100787 RepID=A0A8I3AR25_VERLO|nr:Mitosis inhibitor nif1 like protein [Verticillium longisporum]